MFFFQILLCGYDCYKVRTMLTEENNIARPLSLAVMDDCKFKT